MIAIKRELRRLALKARGSTIQGVTKKELAMVKIPLPKTLPDQIRIATLLSRAEALIEKRRESLRLLDELVKGVFLEMFGDPVRNEKGWEKDKVGAFTDCIVPGREKPKSFTGNFPWITTEDLIDKGFVSLSKKKLGLKNSEIEEVKARLIPAGSVLLTCVGDLGIVSVNTVSCVVNQQLHSFQCKEGMDNVFLMYALSFQKKFMFKVASTTTVAYMNKTICNSIPVIKPPPVLQTQFATTVQRIEALKAKYEASLSELEKLYGSLSQRAFRGELDLRGIAVNQVALDEVSKRIADSLIPLQDAFKAITTPLAGLAEVLKTVNLGISLPQKMLAAVSQANLNLKLTPAILESMSMPSLRFDKKVLEGFRLAIESWLNTLRAGITFEEFVEMEGVDYEQAKEGLFELLKGNKPFLKQEFDDEKKQIIFRLNETA